ncbi:MAG: ATP-binding protein, partial [Chloroflexota bacterium]
LQIYDGETISPASLLFDSQAASNISSPLPQTPVNKLIAVDFEGHRWTLRFSQTGNLVSAADNSKVWLFFLGGTCISFLVFGLTLSLLRTRITAKRIAKKLTLDLREREENLSITLYSIGDGVIATDLDGNVVRLNPSASKLCGYTFREADGKPFSEIFNIINTDTRKPAANPVKYVLDTGQIFKLDNHTILVSKDGIEYQIADSAAPIKDKDGLISGVVIVFSDVTEKNKTEAELRKTSEQLKSIMEGTRDVIAMLDTNYRYILFNPAFHEEFKNIFGVDIHPGDSMPAALAHLSDDQADAMQYWRRALAGEDFTISQQFGDTKLKRNWYELHFSPIRNKEGIIISAVHIVRNISERKQAESDLQAARDELEIRVIERTSELQAANIVIQKASKAKDEFIAIMSHELRTPLTGILGLSQVMQFPTYGDLSPKQLSTVQNIEKSGQHLLELINQILDYSKIQSGKLEMQPLPCSLNKICQSALQMVNSLANKKNQELTFNISPENIFLNADERRLRQVLLNLLGNAIKFTPEAGHIILSVIGLPKTHQVMISVRDSGIGIKPEDLSKLFEPFVQLDMRLSREYEGTGLGLALVKQMVELHGGQVKVESILGSGSLFTIHLPWLGTTI